MDEFEVRFESLRAQLKDYGSLYDENFEGRFTREDCREVLAMVDNLPADDVASKPGFKAPQRENVDPSGRMRAQVRKGALGFDRWGPTVEARSVLVWCGIDLGFGSVGMKKESRRREKEKGSSTKGDVIFISDVLYSRLPKEEIDSTILDFNNQAAGIGIGIGEGGLNLTRISVNFPCVSFHEILGLALEHILMPGPALRNAYYINDTVYYSNLTTQSGASGERSASIKLNVTLNCSWHPDSILNNEGLPGFNIYPL
ncbi:hypothetical protein COLO4_25446 [Corchorus olitorius]|uniref:Uncharacterized protein n=1 Tax=Corchorus olitorius TaxID=93759 RepID=A0A1R3I2I3_9ROSI|nr:hypothetical protein COLO4_25446 [Corchorus olitorius]